MGQPLQKQGLILYPEARSLDISERFKALYNAMAALAGETEISYSFVIRDPVSFCTAVMKKLESGNCQEAKTEK